MSFLSTLTGSFAMPAAENPTVAMVEAAYRHHGIDARYLNCQVAPEALGDAVRGAKAMGWAGFNCSLPHKVAVIEHLDGLGESAEVIGAVNTAVRRDGRWIGENTDGQGFMAALRTLVDPAGKRLVVLGAGGAARAIAVEAALAGAASITVVNRGRDRGEELAALLNARTPLGAAESSPPGAAEASPPGPTEGSPPGPTEGGAPGAASGGAGFAPWQDEHVVPEGTDILVNATSIGLFPDVDARVPVDLDSLRAGMVVADVIGNPPRTRLIRDAEARGCTVLDGLGMLVNQGVIAIRHWTGVDPDPAVMRAELEAALSR